MGWRGCFTAAPALCASCLLTAPDHDDIAGGSGGASPTKMQIRRRTKSGGEVYTVTNGATTLTTAPVDPPPLAGSVLLVAVAISEKPTSNVTADLPGFENATPESYGVLNDGWNRLYLLRKVAGESESATVTVTIEKAAQFAVAMFEYEGVDPSDWSSAMGEATGLSDAQPRVSTDAPITAAGSIGFAMVAHNAKPLSEIRTDGWTQLSGVSTEGGGFSSDVTLLVAESNEALPVEQPATVTGDISGGRPWSAYVVGLRPAAVDGH